ncbi:hypothetical protein PF005_g8649 [Phytophthora fragariae]|uniref:Uncharacterized protein n=1 Tax=Phytophthora fragariae TaxID=53985 RepID=A0A6A3F4W4_9STRA|nr:hypothetical protein PF003_g40317 [Phytophthora fragariae]KAE8940313.1 hypothetical protein PF009_g9872 [Phytophthora fragariae]KAE9118175.1 hypothetical protein PF007_g9021 [Phytophthora fragariae]KAE9147683.1 hypothetical protein PF006_g7654 [Phytophthora fragariae]KAE9217447.1 hypothetical protein PF005_g8649 [Phytophthora fragariae]
MHCLYSLYVILLAGVKSKLDFGTSKHGHSRDLIGCKSLRCATIKFSSRTFDYGTQTANFGQVTNRLVGFYW